MKGNRDAPNLRIWIWGLTGLSFLILGTWLYQRRFDFAAISWAQQGPVILGLIALYGFSAVINFAVWRRRNPAAPQIVIARDLYLYAYSNLSRRLPSGLGYFLVRAARYSSEGLDGPSVIVLSFQELSLQVVAGVILTLIVSAIVPAALQVNYILFILCGGLFIALGHTSLLGRIVERISKGRYRYPERFLNLRTWYYLLPYALTWLNGGLVLYWLLSSLTNNLVISLWEVMLLWFFSGTLGLVGGLFPIGQFARDAALSVLLTGYIPFSVAVLVALVFRLVLTVGDVCWSLIFMVVGTLTHRRYC